MIYDDKFEKWIVQNGGEILPTTSQWELLRYKVPSDGLCIIYQNSKGAIKLTGATKDHYQRFENGQPIKIHNRAEIGKVKKTIREELAERDGAFCWYCQIGADETPMTLEHIVGVNSGGPNHMSNYALACSLCNTVVGDLPVVEKMKFHGLARKSYMVGLNIHEDQNAKCYVPWVECDAT